MLAAIVLNGILGFAMLIAMLFCMGDIEAAVSSPTGYPFIELFHQATRSVPGTTGMVLMVIIVTFFATILVFTTASRMLWAFARDNGVPLASYLSRVSTIFLLILPIEAPAIFGLCHCAHQPPTPLPWKRAHPAFDAQVDRRRSLPLYSLAASTVIPTLIALINIASTTAFTAVTSLVVAAYFVTYLISIALVLWRRLVDPDGEKAQLRWGPWKMGRWTGAGVNVFALVFGVVATVFSFFPTTSIFSPESMNWSVLILGLVVVGGVVDYVARGRNIYQGPIIERTEEITHAGHRPTPMRDARVCSGARD